MQGIRIPLAISNNVNKLTASIALSCYNTANTDTQAILLDLIVINSDYYLTVSTVYLPCTTVRIAACMWTEVLCHAADSEKKTQSLNTIFSLLTQFFLSEQDALLPQTDRATRRVSRNLLDYRYSTQFPCLHPLFAKQEPWPQAHNYLVPEIKSTLFKNSFLNRKPQYIRVVYFLILKFYRKVYCSDTEACQGLHLFPLCDCLFSYI